MTTHAPPTPEQRAYSQEQMAQTRRFVHRANALEARIRRSAIERTVARALADALPLPESFEEWYSIAYVACREELGAPIPGSARDVIWNSVRAIYNNVRGNAFDAGQFIEACHAGAARLEQHYTEQLQALEGGLS